jgi:multisubunit Na+/H+ antiporter MnhB subunit
MRRVVAVIAIVVGIGLIATDLSYSFFARAKGGEQITDRFRTTMSSEGLAALDQNFATIKGLGNELINDAAPAFAGDLGMSQAEFVKLVQDNFPATAQALTAVPPAIALVDPVIPKLKASHADFQQVDRIPGLELPIQAVPWMLVIVAVLLVGGGIAGLLFTGSLLPAVAIGIVALAMIAVPLALNLPSKAAAADRIVKVGDASLSRKAADTATATVALLDKLVPEVQTKVVPALADRLHTTPEKLGATIADNYPGVAKGLADWPKISPTAAQLATDQRASVHEAAAMDGLPFKALPWFVIAPGILLALLAGVALQRKR